MKFTMCLITFGGALAAISTQAQSPAPQISRAKLWPGIDIDILTANGNFKCTRWN